MIGSNKVPEDPRPPSGGAGCDPDAEPSSRASSPSPSEAQATSAAQGHGLTSPASPEPPASSASAVGVGASADGEPRSGAPMAAELGELLRVVARRYGAEIASDAVGELWARCQAAGLDVRDYRAYLEAMARTAAIDKARREQRERAAVEMLARRQMDTLSPESRVEAADMLERTLGSLSPRERETIIRVRGLGQTHEEVADAMGLPTPMAPRALLHRATIKLQAAAAKLDKDK